MGSEAPEVGLGVSSTEPEPVDLVRVLVVDDSEVARSVLADVVGATAGFTVVGSSGSGEEALRLLPRLDPDLVLLDVQMPGLSGPETASRIADTHPGMAVLLVSADAPDFAGSPVAAFLPKREVSPHKLRELWEATRAEAAALRITAQERREEAQALTAQAEHQLRRAKRIRCSRE